MPGVQSSRALILQFNGHEFESYQSLLFILLHKHLRFEKSDLHDIKELLKATIHKLICWQLSAVFQILSPLLIYGNHLALLSVSVTPKLHVVWLNMHIYMEQKIHVGVQWMTKGSRIMCRLLCSRARSRKGRIYRQQWGLGWNHWLIFIIRVRSWGIWSKWRRNFTSAHK